jgi:outer membrane biosynthesis protein TonB
MEREQIIRQDFPTSRKGWDPSAVRAHLESVADAIGGAGVEPNLGDVAAGQVRGVLAAAEAAASEIRTSADSEAGRIVAEARAEAEQLLERSRADAGTHTSAAQEAVDGLVAEAEDLRARVAELSERVAGSAGSHAEPASEVPGPVIVPEPTPPTIPEPTPDPVPEPTPDPSPDPMPDPVPEPTPDPTPEPLPDPAPEPTIEPPAPDPGPLTGGTASTDDLIAQLRAGSAGGGSANGSGTAPATSGSDLGAARLVAMNMALDGSDRSAIAARLEVDFAELPDRDGLLDEVLDRANR